MKMRSILLGSVSLTLALALGGCGSSSGGNGGSGGSSGTGGGGGACINTTGSGTSMICTSQTSTVPGFSCQAPEKTGSCPATNLFGCCTTTMQANSYTTLTTVCYYDKTGGTSAMKDCNTAQTKWSSSLP